MDKASVEDDEVSKSSSSDLCGLTLGVLQGMELFEAPAIFFMTTGSSSDEALSTFSDESHELELSLLSEIRRRLARGRLSSSSSSTCARST